MSHARSMLDAVTGAIGPITMFDGKPLDMFARLDAHELVELRALLASRVEAIDARLRELDGRNTAGSPSLHAERCGCGLAHRHDGPCAREVGSGR